MEKIKLSPHQVKILTNLKNGSKFIVVSGEHREEPLILLEHSDVQASKATFRKLWKYELIELINVVYDIGTFKISKKGLDYLNSK